MSVIRELELTWLPIRVLCETGITFHLAKFADGGYLAQFIGGDTVAQHEDEEPHIAIWAAALKFTGRRYGTDAD